MGISPESLALGSGLVGFIPWVSIRELVSENSSPLLLAFHTLGPAATVIAGPQRSSEPRTLIQTAQENSAMPGTQERTAYIVEITIQT